MKKLTQNQIERQEAIKTIKKYVQEGNTLYTILRHVSNSGMYRVVDVYAIKENEPLRLSWRVAKAIGFKYDRKHEGIGVGGCGMDVGFEVVYNLSRVLFCPDNYDHDKAYSLKQRWI